MVGFPKDGHIIIMPSPCTESCNVVVTSNIALLALAMISYECKLPYAYTEYYDSLVTYVQYSTGRFKPYICTHAKATARNIHGNAPE